MIDIRKDCIPKEAEVGDVLNIVGDKITIDVEKTEKKKKEIEDLAKDLWA